MDTNRRCPPEREIREFFAASFQGHTTGSTGPHLRDCAECRLQAEDLLRSDPLLAELRAAYQSFAPSVSGSVVDEIIRRAAPPPAAADSSSDLSFLDPPARDHPKDLGRFDRYRIVEKLGQGGMGMVFLAVDTTLDRTVALKIILPAYAADPGLRERFLQEAQATVKVRSPHVAEVFDCGLWKEVPYLTMERLVGETLDKKPKPMPLERWRRIAYGITKGLADAHRAGLIHRDLKPGNIHLGTDARTGKPTVKIIDFGLARPVDRKVEMTKSGVMLGTPAYMSLEQARGERVDHRTDLYSLGVILFQLATGKLPYSNTSSVMAILTELAAPEPLPSVAQSAPEFPPDLVALVDRLLAKSAQSRPASADDVLKALKASVSGDATASAADVAVATAAPVLARALPARSEELTVRPQDDRTLVEPVRIPRRQRPHGQRPNAARRSPLFWPIAMMGFGTIALAIAYASGLISPRSKEAGNGMADRSADTGGGPGPADRDPGAPSRAAQIAAKWDNLPNLTETPPRWQPVAADVAASIQTARATAIKDLPALEAKALGEHMLAHMMRGAQLGLVPYGLFPPANDPNAVLPALTVPAKFLLYGDLVGVRTHNDKTWVILGSSTGGAETFGRSVGCLVEFPSPKLAALMMDYRAGDRVRILATRSPREELRAIVPPQAPAEVRELMLETRYGISTIGQPRVYWGFRGEGIEKSNSAGTWIDPLLGRAETAANDAEIRRTPTFFIRDPSAANGTRGRVVGAFRSMGKSSSGISFTMQLGQTAEGAPLLHCYMTGASLEEFFDYVAGDAVEAEVAIAAPQPSPHVMPMFGPGPPLRAEGFSLDAALQADCLRVRKVGKPDTTIVQLGERRSNLARGKVTPDAVYANPDRHVGAAVSWTGPLKKLRVIGDGTHLLVGVSGSLAGLTAFEARVPGKAFVDELADFVPSEESSAKADTVIVTGVVESPVPGAERFQEDAPLIRLDRIERPGDPDSAAVSGQKREPKSFRSANPLDDFTKLFRNPPPVGTAVRFQGRYGILNIYDLTILLNPPQPTYSGNLRVKFTGATDASLKDYKTGDLVTVEAVVEELGNASNRPKLRGKSIVRNANARSLVTESGRAFPPLDFSAMEKLWNDVYYASNPNTTDPLRGGGIYVSHAGLEGRLKIELNNGFFAYGKLALYCPDTPANRKALGALEPGEELIFEAKAVTPPKGRSASYYRQLEAQWIAPIGTPDRKIELHPKP